jgi:vancomycin permeability regulator SanA
VPAQRRRRLPRRLVWAAVVVLVVGAVPVAVVQLMGQAKVRGSLDGLDPRPVVIVPGAGLTPEGTPSVYLERRLAAARDLYRAGTVGTILVSGDASTPYHDEPSSMRRWLLGQGVPDAAIIRDGGGLDTHDTCVRARTVYGVRSAIVVTQDYHVRRMLFSCQAAGIDVVGVGVSATSVTPAQAVVWRLREVPASWKAFLDAALRRPPVVSGPSTFPR